MAKLAETFLIEYLNRQGFAVAQSVKYANREWDILAISGATGTIRARHYEAQVSFDPVSYISAGNATKRNKETFESDMEDWYQKKFEHPEIQKIRSHFYNGDWEKWFVHGVIKEQRELDWLQNRGVHLLTFREVLTSLCASHPRELPYTAEGKDIVEVVRNMLQAE